MYFKIVKFHIFLFKYFQITLWNWYDYMSLHWLVRSFEVTHVKYLSSSPHMELRIFFVWGLYFQVNLQIRKSLEKLTTVMPLYCCEVSGQIGVISWGYFGWVAYYTGWWCSVVRFLVHCQVDRRAFKMINSFYSHL